MNLLSGVLFYSKFVSFKKIVTKANQIDWLIGTNSFLIGRQKKQLNVNFNQFQLDKKFILKEIRVHLTDLTT